MTISALLHDPGHPPFSHAFLRGLSPKLNSLGEVKEDKFWTKLILENLDTIYQPITDGEIREKIVAILSHDHYLSPVISSEVDLDRIDYLKRDSHFCGLPYSPDDSYLLNSFDTDGKTFWLNKNGIGAAEGLLFSRRQMKNSVYQHPTVRAYEDALTILVATLLDTENNYFFGNLPEFFQSCRNKNLIHETLAANFLNLSEVQLWTLFKEFSEGKESTIKTLSSKLLNREKIDPIKIDKPTSMASKGIVK